MIQISYNEIKRTLSIVYYKKCSDQIDTFRLCDFTLYMGWNDLTKISAFLVYSGTTRILSQYFADIVPDNKKKEFEASIVEKTSEFMQSHVFIFEQYIVVFREINDLVLILVGGLQTNELIFDQLLETMCSAMTMIYKIPNMENVVQQIEYMYFLIDETIDQGFVFEGTPSVVASRVMLKSDNSFSGVDMLYGGSF